MKDKIWFDENKKYHREDGPAIEFKNGTKMWFIHGKLHRENRPAIVWTDGKEEYYINSRYINNDR
jgi:hypothetical protein